MKNFILVVTSCLLYASCTMCNDDDMPVTEPETLNKVLLLKVDMTTNTFEGGRELIFPQTMGYTLTTSYNEPGDFGDVALMYEEAGANIFTGIIVWAGLGQMTYPEDLYENTFFATLITPVAMPAAEEFELVDYSENAYYPETIDYDAIWDAVDDLSLVKQYRIANPNSKINLFLYTPSVGVGDPAEWDWYLIFKN